MIGGGIAGVATALAVRARQPAASIALFEGARIGHGASGRNAGFLSPLAAPCWLTGATSAPEPAWAARRIRGAIEAAATALAALAPDARVQPATLRLIAQHRLERAALSWFADAMGGAGLAHARGPGEVSLAAHVVDPYRLVIALAERAAAAGVAICERAAVRSIAPTRRGAELTVDGARVDAARVIVCTNAAPRWMPGRWPRGLPIHTFLLSAPAPQAPARDESFIVEMSRSQAYHRLGGPRAFTGGGDQPWRPRGADGDVPERVRNTLVRQHASRDAVPAAAVDVWSGSFFETATGLPHLGIVPALPAAIWNVGYGGTGFGLALACAPMVAALTDGGPMPEDDARLLATMAATRWTARGAVGAVAEVARRFARPGLLR